VARQALYVEPTLVVEVAFAEWTGEGRLRHPSYLGRRFDKQASEVGREN
jgi:bifunctional non-homologous end joining protein LigD